ncbi:MAG: MmcQ/YjbR family DNA-binding protein [Planctomycetota bacterium]
MPRKPTESSPDPIEHLRQFGLRRFPEAQTRSPWPGHLDLVVRDKTFAWLTAPDTAPSIGLKLPLSRAIALQLPGAVPTAYGLGRSGWVTLDPTTSGGLPPLEVLEEWLEESYRAQAPKRLVAQLDNVVAAEHSATTAPRKQSRRARRSDQR